MTWKLTAKKDNDRVTFYQQRYYLQNRTKRVEVWVKIEEIITADNKVKSWLVQLFLFVNIFIPSE